MLNKSLKLIIAILVFFIHCHIYAQTNDSHLIRYRYEGIYAVYDGPDRIHLYEAERYIFNGSTAYCIELGLPLMTNTYSSTEDWQITSLNADIKNEIRLLAYYGYDYEGHQTMNYYLATQELIWRKLTGRNIYWVSGESANSPRVTVDKEKEVIINLVANHAKTPSFDNQTIEVNLNQEKIVFDQNKVLSYYEIYSSDVENAIIDGNELKIMVTEPIKNTQIKLIKKNYTNSAALIYYSGNNQKMIKAGFLDPVVAIANVNIKIFTKVKVTKIDKEKEFIIKKSDIRFKIKNLDTNEYICESADCIFRTDNEGTFITNLLTEGNYQIEEIENQDIDGYLWNKEPLKFTIDEKSQITYQNGEPIIAINFPNQQIKANVKTLKLGEKAVIQNGQIIYEEIPLTGVSYKLYANENIYRADGQIIYRKNQVIFDKMTTWNGRHELLNMPLGKYCYQEVSTLPGYIVDDKPYCFELKYQDRYTTNIYLELNFKNYLSKGSLHIVKKNNSNLSLSNAHISVYTEDNELVGSGITNENGQFILDKLPIGKYYYKEMTAPEGYIIDNNKHYFEIKDNEEVVNEEFINKIITGTFEFLKTDYTTNAPLPNTMIEIYNEEDELLYSEITNEEGKIIIESIPYGKYYFLEKEAPDGYAVDNQKYYFEIKENDVIIKANMTNERIKVPNTYLNESLIVYLISILGIIGSIFLITRKFLILKIIGITVFIISIAIPIYKVTKKETNIKVSEAAIINYINNTSQTNNNERVNSTKPNYNYIAVIEIPNINLKQGLVNKYSKYNDIKYNVQIIDGSNMPDIINSNLILAAHSGTSNVAYFKDLSKVSDNDLVYIYYSGIKYIYKINNHYEVKKTGYIDIERDKTTNAITLITCKDDNYQLVYLGYLINKEAY